MMNENIDNNIVELDEEVLEQVAGGKDYKIKVDEANVRSGPGTNYGINGKLKKGKVVTYLNDKKKDKNGKTWVYVSDGKIYGWVRSDLLK